MRWGLMINSCLKVFRPALSYCAKCVLLLLLCWPLPGKAQPTLQFDYLDTKPNNPGSGSHFDVKMDANGIVWIIQNGSIVRYDGSEFHSIRITSEDIGLIFRFFESPSGRKYVIDHLNQVFEIAGDSLRPHALNDTLSSISRKRFCSDFYVDRHEKLHIAFHYRSYITIDSNLYIEQPFLEQQGKLNGVFLFFNSDRPPFSAFFYEKDFINSSKQHLYLVNESMEVFSTFEISPNRHSYPTSIIPLANGNYLFSSGRGHLIELNRKGVVREIPYESFIIGLLSDNKGGLWISTDSGIHYYRSGVISAQNKEVILKNTFSVAVLEDFQGGVWIQSRQKGLLRIDPHHYRTYNRENGMLRTTEMSMASVNKKHLTLGLGGNRLDKIDLITHAIESIEAPVVRSPFSDAFYDKAHNRQWVAARGSLFYEDANKWKKIALNQLGEDHKVLRLRLEHALNDTVSLLGLGEYNYFFLNDTVLTYVSPSFPHFITSVKHIGDTTWVGTQKGLYVQVGETIRPFNPEHKALSGSIRQIAGFAGWVWISTFTNGVFILKNDTLSRFLYDGEPVHQFSFIGERSKKGELWAQTPEAVFLLSHAKPKNHACGIHVSIFASPPQRNFWQTLSTDSSIYWITDKEGVIAANYRDIMAHSRHGPHLTFTEVRINNVVQSLGDTAFDLSHDQNYLQIFYSGINYSAAKVQYRYRIAGLKEEWETTEERSLQLIALPPGEYRFEIESRLAYTPWSATKALHFHIAPPYWFSWWFLLLVALALISLTYAFLVYRISRSNRENSLIIDRLRAEQKALSAKMDPHFMFNVLASLQYLVSNNLNEKASKFLEKLAFVIRNTLDQTTYEAISLRSEVEFLKGYIELEQIRLEDKFDYSIEGLEFMKWDLKIPVLLIQPLVENAIQHGLKNRDGQGGQLKLYFATIDGGIKVTVEDNGVGIKRTMNAKARQKSVRQSHALNTIKDRLKLHNGRAINAVPLIVQDLSESKKEGTGTMVTMLIRTLTTPPFYN